MNDNPFSEQDLLKMLISNEEALVTKALNYIYQNPFWRSLVQESVACLPTFFEAHYAESLAGFKNWLTQKGNTEKLNQKGLPATIKKVWREYIVIFAEDDDLLLQMFRLNENTASLAMDICYGRFYPILEAWLIKKEPSQKDVVVEVLQNTFFNVFEYLKRTTENFKFTSNMEAYFRSSCKYAYWSYRDKKQIPFEDRPNDLDPVYIHWTDFVDNEEANCFETKIFPKMREPCQKILGMAFIGYRNPEIAKEHDYTIGYVKRRKSECLNEARALAEKYCGDL